MSEQKACPFCGKNKAIIDTLNFQPSGKPAKFRAQCQVCLVATTWFDTADEAWEAWNRRETEILNHVFNRDVFIFNNLMYARSRKGNCTAQKEFRGNMVRIKEDAFTAAYEECKKATGEKA